MRRICVARRVGDGDQDLLGAVLRDERREVLRACPARGTPWTIVPTFAGSSSRKPTGADPEVRPRGDLLGDEQAGLPRADEQRRDRCTHRNAPRRPASARSP